MSERMVLYAEDDFANRKLMEIQLARNGITVQAVENGRKAWEAWQEGQYEVIILDQNMPEMTGSEVARAIRETGSTIPIIALTSDDAAPEHYADIGFTHILIKPIQGEALLDVIRGHLKS